MVYDNRVCTIHIICFDCPFKLGSRGRKGNMFCQYGKTRSHNNEHGKKRLKINV